MQRERYRRNDIFDMGGPFGNLRSFGMMPSLFGRQDPFDDPFFSRPFGSLFQSPTSATANSFPTHVDKGIVIEELDSDYENDEEKDISSSSAEQPSVEHPDDNFNDGKSKNANHTNHYNRIEGTKPPARNISFQTSKVTYGGVDGAYYTSSRAVKTGNDGTVVEERKEADKTTGQATHRISRGIHDKGHSLTRKLDSDGQVNTTQTLHNLNEDELAGFEESWKGNVEGQLPGWNDQFGFHGTRGSGNSRQKGLSNWAGWTLPSAEQSQNSGATSGGKAKKVARINID